MVKKKIKTSKLALDLALPYLFFLISSLMHCILSPTKFLPQTFYILFYFTAFRNLFQLLGTLS